MTDAPTQSSPAVPSDPLARLHHMSSTAGVTGQEYVAVNLPAIGALFLGIASVLVLVFHSAVLLVIPLAALAFGVTSIRQIKQSNGTQTGWGLEWVGILLALGLGGTEFVVRAVEAGGQRSDQQQLAQMFKTLGDHVGKGDYPAAYAMFTDRFKARVSPEKFAAQWKAAQDMLSSVKSIEWNGVPMIFEADGAGTPMGTGLAMFHFNSEGPTGGQAGRQQIIFRKEGQVWQFDDIPAMFPPEKRNPRAPSPEGPAGPIGPPAPK